MRLKRNHKVFLGLLLLLGVVIQGLTMFRSGLIYGFGMGFWGPNGHDGVWHLALANQVLKGFPPPHPTFAGSKLTNYHYFYDLFLALVNRLTTIPIVALYFQIFPLFLAFGLGILSFCVGYYWRKDFWTGFWLTFLNYFAGSFGFLVTLWRSEQLGGESLFWSMQSISTLINPPFALSLVVLLVGMLTLIRTKKWNLRKIVVTGLLFGILINIKAYAGLVGLTALAVFSLFKCSKKERVYLQIFGLALVISLVIFVPLNKGAGSLFVWRPFWFIHSMIESPDRFYWPRLATARYVFSERGLDLRLVTVEIIGLAIFLIGNLGTRLVGSQGLIERFRKKEVNEFDWFLITGALTGLLPTLLWIQRGTAWNTIQFFYYFLFFVNFYAAVAMAQLVQKRTFWFLLVVVIFTLPTTFASFRGYLGWPPPAAISGAELEGLNFLKEKKPSIVLTFPYDQFEKKYYPTTPLPLKVYESTAYVAAFSGQQTFLEDEVNLNISGYDWQGRHDQAVNFFGSEDKFWARGFLLNNQIGYLYLTQDRSFRLNEEDLGIKKIFENSEVKIYQVSGII